MKRAVLIISILLSINVLTAQSLNYYNLEPFTVVDINFVGEVVIKQCAISNEVTIESNDYKFIEHTHVVVSDGKLSIYMDKNSSLEKKDYIQMEIHLPRLEKLTLLGAGNVKVEKRNEPNLTVINSGVGECTLQCLKIEGSLELHNKGAGDIKVSSPDPIRQQTLLINNSGEAQEVRVKVELATGLADVRPISDETLALAPGEMRVYRKNWTFSMRNTATT